MDFNFGDVCSTSAFAQTAKVPKVGGKPLVQITSKGPAQCAPTGQQLAASIVERLATARSVNGTSRQLVRCSDMSEVGGTPEVSGALSNRRD